ncbi:hypothetical protein Q9S36_18050 [Microbacterium sp. ARD31]|uniref:LmrA/YxaF family transcription factor n=1 Tax=Microbacterium sp. ARD31 TaxID=2962576 RepID=UPI002881C380|nr:hypothetical protein [Microbacterium sp. ARD31]MDT0182082.1 hypothetical protein [Microbacterium sp. ARD31]
MARAVLDQVRDWFEEKIFVPLRTAADPQHASVRAYFSGWVDALAGTLRLTGLTPQESATRALDAVAAIQGGLILARAYGDDETFLGIVDRTEKALLAPAR